MPFGYYCNSMECVHNLHAVLQRLLEKMTYEDLLSEEEEEIEARMSEILRVIDAYLSTK